MCVQTVPSPRSSGWLSVGRRSLLYFASLCSSSFWSFLGCSLVLFLLQVIVLVICCYRSLSGLVIVCQPAFTTCSLFFLSPSFWSIRKRNTFYSIFYTCVCHTRGQKWCFESTRIPFDLFLALCGGGRVCVCVCVCVCVLSTLYLPTTRLSIQPHTASTLQQAKESRSFLLERELSFTITNTIFFFLFPPPPLPLLICAEKRIFVGFCVGVCLSITHTLFAWFITSLFLLRCSMLIN